MGNRENRCSSRWILNHEQMPDRHRDRERDRRGSFSESGQTGILGLRQFSSRSDFRAKLVRELEKEGANALAFQADVSQEEEVETLFQTVEKDLGTPEALVNNAGILDLQTRVDRMNAERIQRIFAVNVTGSFLCAREAVKRMSTKYGGKGGSIVNLSSG